MLSLPLHWARAPNACMHWAHACMHWAHAPNEDFCMHVACSIESTMHPCRGCAYVLWPARTRSCGSSSPPPCPWLDVHGSMSMAPTPHATMSMAIRWEDIRGVWDGHVGWACGVGVRGWARERHGSRAEGPRVRNRPCDHATNGNVARGSDHATWPVGRRCVARWRTLLYVWCLLRSIRRSICISYAV